MKNNERLAIEALAAAQKCIAEAMEGVVTESPAAAKISIREALGALDTALVAAETANDNLVIGTSDDVIKRGEAYMSRDPKLPEGYATVLGYLADTNPEAIDLMTDPIADTQRDGFKLAAWAKVYDFPVVKVAAPEVLQDAGIETVKAYPVEWVARRFGDAA